MSKAAFTEMQEEIMKSKFQEAQLTSQYLELKQKLMELETSVRLWFAVTLRIKFYYFLLIYVFPS